MNHPKRIGHRGLRSQASIRSHQQVRETPLKQCQVNHPVRSDMVKSIPEVALGIAKVYNMVKAARK
jgi:hypothetical protein